MFTSWYTCTSTSLRGRDEVDHLLNRRFGRDREIRIGGHGDIVSRRFRARPRKLLILAHRKLDASAKRRFERGLIHFAVSLRGVAVAHLEERSFDGHRDVER